VELIVGFNFVLNNNSTGQTVAAGQTASFNLDAVPLGNGSTFPSVLSLSCSSAGMPALSTCAFTPTNVSAGSSDTNVRLNIVTNAASVAAAQPGTNQPWYGTGFLLAGLVIGFSGVKSTSRRSSRSRGAARKKKRTLALAVLGIALSVFGACGTGGGGSGNGAGSPGTPSGNYTVTVNGVVGSITRSVQVVLTVQ
jgi:hypothetical protein